MENDDVKNNPEVTRVETEKVPDLSRFRQAIKTTRGMMTIPEGLWIILSLHGKEMTICLPRKVSFADQVFSVNNTGIKEYLLGYRKYPCSIESLCLDVRNVLGKVLLFCYCRFFYEESWASYDREICDPVQAGHIYALAKAEGGFPVDGFCLYSRIIQDGGSKFCFIKESPGGLELSEAPASSNVVFREKEKNFKYQPRDRFCFYQDISKYDSLSKHVDTLIPKLDGVEERAEQRQLSVNFGRSRAKKYNFDIAIGGVYFLGLRGVFKSSAIWLADLLSQHLGETVEVFRMYLYKGEFTHQPVHKVGG